MMAAQLRTPATGPTQRWIFLSVISLGLLMVGLDNSILYTALPTLRAQLDASELEGLWMINAYPLVLAGLLLGTGTLGDKIGHRRMWEIGLLFFGAASAIAAAAPNPEVLIAARALLGVGAATMMPATLSLLRFTFHNARERNLAIGVWASVATIGAAAGPVLGGLLLEHYWWGSVFLINLPVVVIAAIGTRWLAPANVANPTRHWDLLSSLLAMLAMIGGVMAIKEIAHQPMNLGTLLLALLGALLAGISFAHRQRRLAEPLLTFDIFQNRLFSAGVISAVMSMFAISGVEIITTQRFQLVAGYSPLEAGLMTAAAALAAFPTSLLGGAMLHRMGFRPLISGGFAFMALGGLLAIGSAHAGHIGWFLIAMAVIGAGSGLAMSVTSTAIIGSAPRRRAGMAAAMEEVSFEFGTVISVAVLGSLQPMFYAWFAPPELAGDAAAALTDPLTHQVAGGAFDMAYLTTIAIATIAVAVTTVITFVLLKGNPKETEYAHE